MAPLRRSVSEGHMSTDNPDPALQSRPSKAGIAFDGDGRLTSDLPCWTCEYNLRTLRMDADCPECGTPIAITLDRRSGRTARPFSLHTLNPVSRTLGLVFGMVCPALIVLLAALNPMDPLNTDWQSGEIEEIVGVMLAGRAMWAFYPFLLWAYIAFAAVMSAPVPFGRLWWVKAGLWIGCILGLQYQLIVNLNFFGLSHAFWTALVVGLIPLGVLASIVATYAVNDASRSAQMRGRRPWRLAWIQLGVTLALLVGIGIVTQGLVILLALISAPYLMLLCMSAALCRLYRTDFDPPVERTKPIPLVATVGGYAAAWPVAVTQAQIVYSSLPMSDPSCYICTASAHGHRWLTRAKPVRYADGSVLMVTRQMQTLKAAEHLIAEYAPRLHRMMRRVYDHIGPGIASRIQSCWLADVSYLLFVPVAAVAYIVLAWLGRREEIGRGYVGRTHTGS